MRLHQLNRTTQRHVLNEARDVLTYAGQDYDVLIDPTPGELIGALRGYRDQIGRGLLVEDPDRTEPRLIVWDAYDAVHESMIEMVYSTWGWITAAEFEFAPHGKNSRWTQFGPIWSVGPVQMLAGLGFAKMIPPVSEAQVAHQFMVGGSKLIVWKNPTPREITRLLGLTQGSELRGLMDDDDLYVWDAWLMDHDTMRGQTGIGAGEELTVYTRNSLEWDLAQTIDGLEYEPTSWSDTDDPDGDPQWDIDARVRAEVSAMAQHHPVLLRTFPGYHVQARVTITDRRGFRDDYTANIGMIRGNRIIPSVPLGEAVEKIGGATVWTDPGRSQILALARKMPLRGLYTNGHTYVWNAYDYTHERFHGVLLHDDPDHHYNAFERGDIRDQSFVINDEQTWVDSATTEVAPGVYLSGFPDALASPVLRSLIRKKRLGEDDHTDLGGADFHSDTDDSADHDDLLFPAVSESVHDQFWWSPERGFVWFDNPLTHTGFVLNHPEQFGVSPALIAERRDRGNQIRDTILLSAAFERGWVRGALIASSSLLLLEGESPETLRPALIGTVKTHPVEKVVLEYRTGYTMLESGAAIEQFVRTGRLPQRMTEMVETDIGQRIDGFRRGIVYHGTTRAQADDILKNGFRLVPFRELVREVAARLGVPEPGPEQYAHGKAFSTVEHGYEKHSGGERQISSAFSPEIASRWAGSGGETIKQIEDLLIGAIPWGDQKSKFTGEPVILRVRLNEGRQNNPAYWRVLDAVNRLAQLWQTGVLDERDLWEDLVEGYADIRFTPDQVAQIEEVPGGYVRPPSWRKPIGESTQTIRGITYLIDPSPNEVLGALNRSARSLLRGLVDQRGTFVCWDANTATHDQVEADLVRHGVIEPTPFLVVIAAKVIVAYARKGDKYASTDPGLIRSESFEAFLRRARRAGTTLIGDAGADPTKLNEVLRYDQRCWIDPHGQIIDVKDSHESTASDYFGQTGIDQDDPNQREAFATGWLRVAADSSFFAVSNLSHSTPAQRRALIELVRNSDSAKYAIDGQDGFVDRPAYLRWLRTFGIRKMFEGREWVEARPYPGAPKTDMRLWIDPSPQELLGLARINELVRAWTCRSLDNGEHLVAWAGNTALHVGIQKVIEDQYGWDCGSPIEIRWGKKDDPDRLGPFSVSAPEEFRTGPYGVALERGRKSLREGTVRVLHDPGWSKCGEVRVFANPSPEQLQGIVSDTHARAAHARSFDRELIRIIHVPGQVLVWSGFTAVHDDIRIALGLTDWEEGAYYPTTRAVDLSGSAKGTREGKAFLRAVASVNIPT